MSALIAETLDAIPGEFDPQIADCVQARWDSLTKPRGSLGRLEKEVIKLAQIQNSECPSVSP